MISVHCYLWKTFRIISNTRSVGIFKRPKNLNLNTNVAELLRAKLAENRPLTVTEWSQLRSTILATDRQFSEVNIDATIVGQCLPHGQLTVAKSYIAFLKQLNIEPNIATLGRLLRTYSIAASKDAIDDQDRRDIIAIYNGLIAKTDTYDATTCENLIHALVETDEWLKTLPLIDTAKLTAKLSASAYSCIAARAFRENDTVLGWRLLNECVASDRIPKCAVFLAYFDWCRRHETKAENCVEQIRKMLQFIGLHEIVVSRLVVDWLHDVYTSLGYACATVEMAGNGRCPACRKQMRSVYLTNKEFKELSSTFLEKVLLRKDTFLKSTPSEVAKFELFLDQFQPFDCVIDGLNVAFSAGTKKPPGEYAKLLALVVKYFADHNKRLLVLGRRHMLRWPKPQMNFIQANAKVFLTDDLSQDDPFLLYAALKSGPATDFVSRDLMRSHAFLLGAELKPIFRRWQQEHQYYLAPGTNSFGKVQIQVPIKFQTNAHTVDGKWHIPYTDEHRSTPPDSFELPRSWLCISPSNAANR